MSIGPLASLSSGYLQSILSTGLQAVTGGGQTSAKTTASASSLSPQADSGQLSPFAQILSTLQQLQQSSPSQYQQVTSQIATNLQSAAQTAQASGNTTAATQLNQLSSDFSNASQSGQLPNVQDLSQAVGGGHHMHHHHHQDDSSSSSSSSASSTSSSTSSNNSLNQILAAFQSDAAQSSNSSLNPTNIIMNTLSNAGLS